MSSVPPVAFGLPTKFAAFRPDQLTAVDDAILGPARFAAMCAPTGFGKSLAYVTAALVRGGRTAILTSTKGLQTQLMKDFAEIGLVDMRGQNNYQCVVAGQYGFPESTSVAEGMCHAGIECELKQGGCLYYDAYRRAVQAQIIICNYAYWMNIQRAGDGLGEFHTLILDEAHDAPEHLNSFLGAELEFGETKFTGIEMPDRGCDIKQWKEWAVWAGGQFKARYDTLAQGNKVHGGYGDRSIIRESTKLKVLMRKIEPIATMKGEWIHEYIETPPSAGKGPAKHSMRFDPLFPFKYAEGNLFYGIPKVILVSATARPKTCSLLGLGNGDYTFNEYASTFPTERRPIIWVPTAQLNFRTDPTQIKLWRSRIDQILDGRVDRKGIIHTVSYKRARELYDNSRHRGRMLIHHSGNARTTIELFKRETRPVVLVSPSVTTGYDFPYDECEFQIVAKLPFPDNRAKVVKARQEHDKEYSDYMTAQVLVQETGRGMRAEDDRCETLIVDDNIQWFVRRAAKHAPKWWLESYRTSRTVPPAPPKL